MLAQQPSLYALHLHQPDRYSADKLSHFTVDTNLLNNAAVAWTSMTSKFVLQVHIEQQDG